MMAIHYSSLQCCMIILISHNKSYVIYKLYYIYFNKLSTRNTISINVENISVVMINICVGTVNCDTFQNSLFKICFFTFDHFKVSLLNKCYSY